MALPMPTELDGWWHIELWLDGKLYKKNHAISSYEARCMIQSIMKTLDEETKRKIKLYEAFNEVED